MGNPLALTSNVVNYLIYRYLQESGFSHTAFIFGHESTLTRTPIDPSQLPRGSLITFIQKGLQFLELEANIDAQAGEAEDEFKMLTAEELLCNDIEQLRKLVLEKDDRAKEPARKRERVDKKQERAREKDREREKEVEKEREKEREKEKERVREREKVEKAEKVEKVEKVERVERDEAPMEEMVQERVGVVEDVDNRGKGGTAAAPSAPPVEAPPSAGRGQAGVDTGLPSSSGLVPMEEDAGAAGGGGGGGGGIGGVAAVDPSLSQLTLVGHESEVYFCAWNPCEPLLASGSGDSTARIWDLSSNSSYTSIILRHDVNQEQSKDVTTLDWNVDGSLLATGSYDGLARIWTKEGKLKQTLQQHQGPIFALKWNKKGDLLLSGSVDKTAIVWDPKLGKAMQTFDFHTAPTLDVDWRNNHSFATCSSDKLIHVCKLGEQAPIRTFAGHTDEVNAIRWDPSGQLLASCSDDCTAKLWSISSGGDKCVHDLTAHTREIYTIRWSPTGSGTANPNLPPRLATTSFDTTVRLWDSETGLCVTNLQGHSEPVYSVAFSPNGLYVATGSFDQNLHVWKVEDGSLVKSFHGNAGIYEVCWSRDGDKLAACYADKTLSVVDMRM